MQAIDKVTKQRVEVLGDSSLRGGVRVRFPDGSVTAVSRGSIDPIAPPRPNPNPFYVYTRLYKANGDCEKRVHHFPTRKAQQAFMRRTHRAITAYN